MGGGRGGGGVVVGCGGGSEVCMLCFWDRVRGGADGVGVLGYGIKRS